MRIHELIGTFMVFTNLSLIKELFISKFNHNLQKWNKLENETH